MAESKKRRDGSFVLIENHRPIRSAADTCRGLCNSELELFRTVLGRRVEIEREEHILEGDRRCLYRIRPAAGVGAGASESSEG